MACPYVCTLPEAERKWYKQKIKAITKKDNEKNLDPYILEDWWVQWFTVPRDR